MRERKVFCFALLGKDVFVMIHITCIYQGAAVVPSFQRLGVAFHLIIHKTRNLSPTHASLVFNPFLLF